MLRPALRTGAVVLMLAAAVVLFAGRGHDGATARAAANVTMTAQDFFWSPNVANLQVGDSVTWTNTQGFHNVVLGDSRQNQPGFPNDPSWNPPPKVTFTTAGSYTFYCEVHPGMTGTVNVAGGGGPTPTPTPTSTATTTPTPSLPPPGSGPADNAPPTVSGISVTGAGGRAGVTLTVSEPATVNVRFINGDDVRTTRVQVEAGTRTFDRPLAKGRYTYELWAVDAMSNRSQTYIGEVSVSG